MPALVAAAAATQETFAEKLSKAVKTVTAPRPRSTFVAEATGEESFAAKLVKATKARAETVKQHNERAERERSRYKPFQRRKRTKGE